MIVIKSPREIAIMREAGRLVAQAHEIVRELLKPGITTREIDEKVEAFIRSQNAEPSFKGYHGYPASTCISINEELVHGIPGERRIEEGDIVSVDIGVYYKGYHGDSAWTYAVGPISPVAQRLLEVTERSLYAGIEQARPGNRLSDIGHAVQKVVEAAGFSVVREYVGHGIGREMHEDPQVPNYGEPGRGPRLRPGMTLAIEPMVCVGDWRTRVLSDKWTVVSADGSLTAHFEHTVAITEDGPEILTVL
ncbi:MAG: type I methionyl aminopeptidase [Ardenticatenia bacterium]|uniref:Methionine aminopeptidase n=1 Tax=Ardenticatena maritima TaxID=872965 RepID=A0A0M8K776_9CHLR|nr:type I methionyl aminopeptidase [Ardenticatena maritima]KPL90046.1 methionine aminopeptidase [Ardenticatena maritima]RME11737.1 MAG: type I methionyl aminopeptidase [Ardenticatenia bacterium]GAP61889.1 methionyl aminopeptidase [Ardenticatena maritima]